jgi:predicted phosphoribosyltransferase
LLTPALLLSHRAVTSRGQIVWYALAYENLVPVVHAATEAGDDALLTLSETQREVWAQLQDNPVSEAVKDTLSHALILRKYMGPDQLQAVVASIAAGREKCDDTMRLINPETQKTGYQAAGDKTRFMQERANNAEKANDKQKNAVRTCLLVNSGANGGVLIDVILAAGAKNEPVAIRFIKFLVKDGFIEAKNCFKKQFDRFVIYSLTGE